MESLSEIEINCICDKISKNFEKDEKLQPYISEINDKVRTFLSKKPKSEKFNPDKFVNYIIQKIEDKKIKSNTHVGILAAQSIGEPVTQLALSYFHKLNGDKDNIDGVKELHNITKNKVDYDVVEFYLKSKDYDSNLKKKILNSMRYIALNDVVLDVVYDGFCLRFFLCKQAIFKYKIHPKIIFNCIKEYLEKTGNSISKWDSIVNLTELYIEFSQPASKLLDWLDENQVEYIVDMEILCIFKPNINKNKIKVDETGETNDNSPDISYSDNDDDSNSNELQNTAKNELIINYLNNNKIKFEDKGKYYLLNSDFVELNNNGIKKILNNVVLSGTKGVIKVVPKHYNDEFIIEVTGTNLGPLFENEYVDKDRSRYIVYGNLMDVDFESRKKNILKQLQKIVNNGSSCKNQHIELLTNFMCQDNKILSMSRFGMKNDNFSFMSKLSFEDPYNKLLNTKLIEYHI
ncbi:beta and beta-prime subunits of DNA dependent RNA-polymerase [Piromyces finnis]|uniref:DNA-directed RNA polymerase n=1 Tax=Piromyces finnis TaxID=1754191 RepID=A0A1Y1UYY8_9FUNG|nr:beta and beta-prime subunits of DNA dependent RNA-polymerase [Piromyces finnis]|eukprot:ORX42871.1 beta and beta-prime subunits of DNA dependent RNA-polymerase [Piromyces finnis]